MYLSIDITSANVNSDGYQQFEFADKTVYIHNNLPVEIDLLNNLSCSDLSKLNNINGNWIIAVIEKNRQNFFVARNPSGVGKVYCDTDGLMVSDSLACFKSREFDNNSIAIFLNLLYIPPPRTIFKNIICIPQGHAVVVKNKIHKVARFNKPIWETINAEVPNISEKDAFNRFEEKLINAISRHVSSEPTALLLSGGKDSSTLAVAAKLAGKNISAVNIAFKDIKVDESTSAKHLCEYLGTPFKSYLFGDLDYLKSFDDTVLMMDQPFCDPTVFPINLLMNSLKKDFKIVLDGTGNDVYFGIPLSEYEKKFYNIKKFLPESARRMLDKYSHVCPKRFDILLNKLSAPIYDMFIYWDAFSSKEILEILGHEYNPRKEVFNVLSKMYKKEPIVLKSSVLSGMWEPENVFMRTSLSAASNGITPRFPFTDNLLRDFVAQHIPSNLKYNGTTNKILLRKFMQKHLPDSILHKPKGYFIFDTDILLKSNNFELINRHRDFKHHLFKSKAIDSIINEYINGRVSP